MKYILTFLVLTTLSPIALASNYLRGKNFSGTEDSKERVELQVNSELTRKHIDGNKITTADVAAVIPTDIPANSSEELVRDKIIQRSLSSFLKSPIIANSFLMKTAKSVEQSTSIGTTTKAEQSAQPTEKAKVIAASQTPETEHNFKFNVEAFKAEARLSYSGYVNSKLEYKMQDNSIRLSVEEKLSNTSRIALTHLTTQLEQRQYLYYQVSW